jgi:hypothetical protein
VKRHSYAVVVALLLCVSACGGPQDRTFSDISSGLSFRYPAKWSVTGFSHNKDPRRLVVASYRVAPQEVERDCGGSQALSRITPNAAAILLIDCRTTHRFKPHPGDFKLSEFHRASYECFGDSYRLRFRRSGHDLQAHLAIGSRASRSRSSEALGILDSIR